MKTKLPDTISSVKDAKKLLQELFLNDESFHPEDDAHDIVDCFGEYLFTIEEGKKLNELMDQIYVELKDFDPCEYLLDLNYKRNINL